MTPKDRILLHAMALLIVLATVLAATDADAARRFFTCGWPNFFDMWPWS